MLIAVIYPGGKHDMVKEYLLNQMIKEKSIEFFRRGDGWVNIFHDRVRGNGSVALYQGPERRQTMAEMH